MAVVCWLLLIYLIAFVLRAVLSWFPMAGGGVAERAAGVLIRITDPAVRPLQRLLRPMRVGGVGLDFAPAIVMVVILIVRRIIC